jgi:hypothetical protein
MKNKIVLSEIEGILNKFEIKKQLKQELMLQRPGKAQQVSNQMLNECLIYISGYIKCLKYQGLQPINSEEMKSLLTQECIDWMLGYLDGGS